MLEEFNPLTMDTLTIDILNPKAKKLLKDLEEQKLISIRKKANKPLADILGKLRSNEDSAPSLDDIAKIVEEVRTERYGRKDTNKSSD